MFSNQILFHSFHQLSREKKKRKEKKEFQSMGEEEKQEQEEECNIGLTLGLGRGSSDEYKRKRDMNRDRCYKPHHPVQFHVLFPSHHHYQPKEEIVENEVIDIDRLSSKRVDEENDANKNNNMNCNSSSHDDHNKYSSTRKKLRLTKEQSTLLEDSFKQHNTLNQMQKHELAEKLNLQPRQVEVWFQNRRARTKLKQTEVDCEFLKKCCESLSDENKRLKRELQELRSIKLGSSSSSPFYVQFPKSGTLTMCTACERINAKTIENKKLTVMNNKPISKFHGGIDNSSSSSLACQVERRQET